MVGLLVVDEVTFTGWVRVVTGSELNLENFEDDLKDLFNDLTLVILVLWELDERLLLSVVPEGGMEVASLVWFWLVAVWIDSAADDEIEDFSVLFGVLLAWIRSGIDFVVEAAPDVEMTVEVINDEEAHDVQTDLTTVAFPFRDSDDRTFPTVVVGRLEVEVKT